MEFSTYLNPQDIAVYYLIHFNATQIFKSLKLMLFNLKTYKAINTWQMFVIKTTNRSFFLVDKLEFNV